MYLNYLIIIITFLINIFFYFILYILWGKKIREGMINKFEGDENKIYSFIKS